MLLDFVILVQILSDALQKKYHREELNLKSYSRNL